VKNRCTETTTEHVLAGESFYEIYVECLDGAGVGLGSVRAGHSIYRLNDDGIDVGAEIWGFFEDRTLVPEPHGWLHG
jgi:hypothetical protein